MKSRFWSILVGAFLLEGAGYFAFPYISIALRDQFRFSEKEIGTLFLVALGSRPIWSILGGWLGERISGRWLFLAACLAEALGFFILGSSSNLVLGIAAVLLGNFGFSIWTPNLFSSIYKIYGQEDSVKKVSLLNGALNAGAAVGCLAGALLAMFQAKSVFFAASALYLFCLPVLLPVLSTDAEKASSVSIPVKSIQWKMREFFGLLLVSIGFWGTYSQFNSFFSLFAKDWLGNAAFTGVAFGLLALSVSLLSFFFARQKTLSTRLSQFSLWAIFLLGVAWQGKTLFPNLYVACLFVLVLALAEAILTVFLAEKWAKAVPERQGLMQGLNFAFRNISMGIGSLVGGYAYHAPLSSPSLGLWGLENTLFCLVCFLGIMVVSPRSFSEREREKFTIS